MKRLVLILGLLIMACDSENAAEKKGIQIPEFETAEKLAVYLNKEYPENSPLAQLDQLLRDSGAVCEDLINKPINKKTHFCVFEDRKDKVIVSYTKWSIVIDIKEDDKIKNIRVYQGVVGL